MIIWFITIPGWINSANGSIYIFLYECKSEAKKKIRVFFVIKVLLFIFHKFNNSLSINTLSSREEKDWDSIIHHLAHCILFNHYISYLFTSYGMTTLLIPEKRYSWSEKVLESVSLFVKLMEKPYILCLQEVKSL